ncbi:MAG TPA: hypothetical protein HPP80_07840 [Rhodospirillaceae bacterium]|nr:hypothetical protein [Rhodospirillaceae bacterium]
MSGYRLSPLRNKGWVRVAIVGSILVFPFAGIENALGFFSDGIPGFIQAGEFIGSGIALVLVFSFSACWVLRGFAVKSHDEDEERGESHGSRPSGPPSSGAGKPPGHHPPAGQQH